MRITKSPNPHRAESSNYLKTIPQDEEKTSVYTPLGGFSKASSEQGKAACRRE